MPQKGDKLYTVWNGKLEVSTFLEESIVEGATLPTWVVRDSDGRKSRVSPDMYCLTEKEAWQEYYASCVTALGSVKEGFEEAKKHLKYVKSELVRIKKILKERFGC